MSDGSVKRRTWTGPDGKPRSAWRARYRDAFGREHSAQRATRAAAQAWLREQQAAELAGTSADPDRGRQTFGEYARTWAARQEWESSTRTSFNQTMQTVPFRDMRLDRIRLAHVELWQKDLEAKYAASTRTTRLVHVRQVFRGAVADRCIARDPSEGIKPPRTRNTRGGHKMPPPMPTPAQVHALLEVSTGATRLMIALCAFAGLRLGEVVALKRDDFDLDAGTLRVERQRQRDEVRDPKYGSKRTVYLPSELVAMLADYLPTVTHPEGWLFVGERGPAQDNWAHARFRTARKAAGCPSVTIHSLRHFYASGLLAAGVDVVTVQTSLGHSKASTTLDIYAHPTPAVGGAARAGAAAVMSDVSRAGTMRAPSRKD